MFVSQRTIWHHVVVTNTKHNNTMNGTTTELLAGQARRLAAKTQDQRMINEVVTGTGMSPWEAKIVVEVVRGIYFDTPGNAPLRHGQILYTCVKIEAGAGVALKDCPMTSVALSLIDAADRDLKDAATCGSSASGGSARKPGSKAACSPRKTSPNSSAAMPAPSAATSTLRRIGWA